MVIVIVFSPVEFGSAVPIVSDRQRRFDLARGRYPNLLHEGIGGTFVSGLAILTCKADSANHRGAGALCVRGVLGHRALCKNYS